MGPRRQRELFPTPPIDRFVFERALWTTGIRYIAGIDEVGRGCLAGPVVAAAVILPIGADLPGIDDSKRLTPAAREVFFLEIQRIAVAIGMGRVEPAEIDRLNILQATRKAMQLAVAQLPVPPEYLFIDGREVVPGAIPQRTIVKGDRRSASVAAASIIAKVSRDRVMRAYEGDYPRFRFSLHKGYGTATHRAELRANGLTPLHRRSFAPCAACAMTIPRAG